MARSASAADRIKKVSAMRAAFEGGASSSQADEGSTSASRSPTSFPIAACGHYQVDLTALRFGDCKCGFPTLAHTSRAASPLICARASSCVRADATCDGRA